MVCVELAWERIPEPKLLEMVLRLLTKWRMAVKYNQEPQPRISRRTKSGCVSGSIIHPSMVSVTTSATMLPVYSSTTLLKSCLTPTTTTSITLSAAQLTVKTLATSTLSINILRTSKRKSPFYSISAATSRAVRSLRSISRQLRQNLKNPAWLMWCT